MFSTPIETLEAIGSHVTCTLTDASTVSGYLYSIDPESNLTLLVELDECDQLRSALLVPVGGIAKQSGESCDYTTDALQSYIYMCVLLCCVLVFLKRRRCFSR